MRKLVYILLACIAVCAQSCKKNQTAVSAVSIKNPVVTSNRTEIREKLGIRFKEPTDASDIQYSIIAGNLAQMTFVRNGIEYTARSSRQPSFSDISGLYYTWSKEIDTQFERCAANIKLASAEGTTVGVCLWYDQELSCMCSVSMNSGATQQLLENIAREIYTLDYI